VPYVSVFFWFVELQLGSKAHKLRFHCVDQSMLLDFESPSSLIALTDLKVTSSLTCTHTQLVTVCWYQTAPLTVMEDSVAVGDHFHFSCHSLITALIHSRYSWLWNDCCLYSRLSCHSFV